MAEHFYTPEELAAVFDRLSPHYGVLLAGRLGAEAGGAILAGARRDFTTLQAQIPFVGPLSYPLPATLVESAVALSFFRAMKVAGLGTEESGRITVDAFVLSLQSNDLEEWKVLGKQQFTDEWYRMQAHFALESGKRRFPGDWVFDFVPGDGERFDWGWDFTECGIQKLYQAQGTLDLLPFLCSEDFLVSRLQGTGLARSGTLAEGRACCDFRYQQGRDVGCPQGHHPGD